MRVANSDFAGSPHARLISSNVVLLVVLEVAPVARDVEELLVRDAGDGVAALDAVAGVATRGRIGGLTPSGRGPGIDRGEPVLVADVNAFPDHIACDSRSQSEVVVPLRDASGTIVGVLDVDSDRLDDFGPADRDGLEEIASVLRTKF